VTRFRCFLITAGSALPLLFGTMILGALTGPDNLIAAALVWLMTVGLFSEILWKKFLGPLSNVLENADLQSITQLQRRIHQLDETTHNLESERLDTAQLIDDISTGLGEGLLVVDRELHLRLVNPQALEFLGVETIAPGTSLLEVQRDPEVIRSVKASIDGDIDCRIMVENPRGVWEVKPFPLSRGGAVVLMTEVGPLRRSAELRRRFVQDLSHELRSPLTVIRTTVEAMEDDLPSDIAGMMIRQVERITRLTDELYELASIEAGTLRITPVHQSILSLIEQISADFSAVAFHANVDLGTDVPEDFSFAFDRRALSRVISNLVDNAIKYNRPGGWVRITVRHLDITAQIEIEDSGLGIPASELGAVMHRFYRVDRARTPGAGGLGLGLAIVKHMVQQMGGNLVLNSRVNVGTQVRVRFPIEPAP